MRLWDWCYQNKMFNIPQVTPTCTVQSSTISLVNWYYLNKILKHFFKRWHDAQYKAQHSDEQMDWASCIYAGEKNLSGLSGQCGGELISKISFSLYDPKGHKSTAPSTKASRNKWEKQFLGKGTKFRIDSIHNMSNNATYPILSRFCHSFSSAQPQPPLFLN